MMSLYPPTEERLAKLKSLGIVPFSQDLLSAGVIVGLFLGIIILSSDVNLVNTIFQMFEALWSTKDNVEWRQNNLAFAVIISVFLKLLLPVAMLGLICSVCQKGRQSKGIGEGINSKVSIKSDYFGLFDRLFIGLLGGLKALVILALLTLVLLILFKGLLETYYIELLQSPNIWLLIMERDKSRLLDPAYSIMGKYSLWVCILVLIMGAVSYFLARRRFYRIYAMSRAEIEDEYKETELSPIFKDALKHRMQE
ncbi:MAG: EscU/YscU/HrcU family type III secretion system export apparatus switch protein [Deltaproteobacteria bacterium]|nr:EscU/YscU/HrcU family type III secretion system export apparatus switch protein [Deltaproteobacteria bacterium]